MDPTRERGGAMNRDDVLELVADAWRLGQRPDLRYVDLRDTDLRYADLRGADLRGANLCRVKLHDASLYGTNLGRILSVNGLPSGHALIWPTPGEWSVRVGCWTGNLDDLQTLIDGTDWPESEGDEQEARRPGLQAFIELCKAHVAANAGVVEALAEKWTPTSPR